MSLDPSSVPSPPADGDSAGSQRPSRPVAAGQLVHNREFIEFMGRLDQEMRLSAEGVKRKPVLSRSVKLVIAAVLALMLAVGKDTLWSWWSDTGAVPNQLIGAWSTSSDRFQDRGFVIMSDSLQLRLGEGQTATFPISGVRRGRGVDQNLFTFHYRDGNWDLQLGLWMKRDSIAYIANLPGIVWTKESR
jgi:hypothetical protein